MAYTDNELLALVADEKKRSVGFDVNSELVAERERALNYYKGDMSHDMPTLDNRSSAVSTDVADTIETWLSDMVEILATGEDVVTFQPNGEEDESPARQETDYVNHVFFNENPGFMTLYTMLKDAGQVKTGVATWWEEDVPAPEPTKYYGITEAQIGLIQQDVSEEQIGDVKPCDEQGVGIDPQSGQHIPVQLFDVTVLPKPRKRVRIDGVNPADFTVAQDTKRLKDTTYCAMKVRPRAQDLIADGIDPDIVDRLPQYSTSDSTEELARDTVGEHSNGTTGGGNGDLRIVEIIKHYIRLVTIPERVARIWCVRTSNDDALLIDKEEVGEIPFAAITPYPVTHRFYGESIADKTMEPQRVRTSLTRIALDQAYFALNQRNEVSETDSSENTIPDLLRNEPAMPVRSKTGNAVRALVSGSLSFDPFNALEYFATVVEARTGIVRNAQGLNPDTLHDTMGGAAMLAAAAQKRTKLMARIFSETGIKDLYLGVHAMLRRIGGMTDTIKLAGSWVNIDPTAWGERNDMTVVVGGGSAERAKDLAMLGAVIDKQAQAVAAQGGPAGPLVTLENLYASAMAYTRKAGIKNPEAYWTDPKEDPAQPRPPTPQAVAANAQAQEGQAKLALDQQKLVLDQQKAASGDQQAAAKLQLDERRVALDEAELQMRQADQEHAQQLAEARLGIDSKQARDKLDTDSALKVAEINARYKTSIDVASIKSAAEQFRAKADVAMQAASHAHDHEVLGREHDHELVAAVAKHVLGAALAPEPSREAEPDHADPNEAHEPPEGEAQ